MNITIRSPFVRSSATGRSVDAPAPKRTKAQRKAEPMTPRQIGTLSRMLRQYGLVSDDGIAIVGQYRFVYDDGMVRTGKGGETVTGGWRGFETLTKADADVLFALFGTMGKPGFSDVTTDVAEPVVAPKAEPKKRGDTITVDGVTYRIAGVAR